MDEYRDLTKGEIIVNLWTDSYLTFFEKPNKKRRSIMPVRGYQYKKRKADDETGGVEEKIIKILGNFGYVCKKPWPREEKYQISFFRRPYDEIDKKMGVPAKKFAKCGHFGVIEVCHDFLDKDDITPRKISLQPSAGWEFTFPDCDRAFLAMAEVEKTLTSDGYYKIIYKCLDDVEGFETEAEEKARENNSLNTFLGLRFAGEL